MINPVEFAEDTLRTAPRAVNLTVFVGTVQWSTWRVVNLVEFAHVAPFGAGALVKLVEFAHVAPFGAGALVNLVEIAAVLHRVRPPAVKWADFAGAGPCNRMAPARYIHAVRMRPAKTQSRMRVPGEQIGPTPSPPCKRPADSLCLTSAGQFRVKEPAKSVHLTSDRFACGRSAQARPF